MSLLRRGSTGRVTAALAARLASLLSVALVAGSLVGCQAGVASPAELTRQVAALAAVAEADLATPEPGDDWTPTLYVTLTEDATRDEIARVLDASVDGLEDLYGRGYGDGSAELVLRDPAEIHELELVTEDHRGAKVLAAAWAAASEALPEHEWTLSGRGQVHVDSIATAEMADILALATEVASDDRLSGVPGWAFNTSDLGRPITFLATDEPLTPEVVDRWRALAAADALALGRGLEQVTLTPQDQPGYRVEDPAGPGTVNLSARFDHEGVGPFTPAAYGDRLAPLVEALWSVATSFGPGSRLHLEFLGTDDSGDLLNLVVGGDPLPGPQRESAQFAAWTAWAEDLLPD